ncbi:MAG TPA: bifunctional riboflavin kinase/FAD synthetase [Planctomycetaceae bacterium]|nr:bifunctional riboflavin kinase/FAD synthetase [Planctomycetaceae bacterium]
MQGVVQGWDVPEEWRGGFAAIGNFDGVHRGHQSLFQQLTATAKTANVPSIVVTFDPPPLALLRPAALPPRLTTIEQRVELIRRAGIDGVWILPTTWELLRLAPAEFFERVVLEKLAARGLVEGSNFYFGRDRAGTIEVLRELCTAHRITLDVIEPVRIHGEWVSSSAIRTALTAGDLATAVRQLGHPYRLCGQVVDGAHRGRTLGFPTANLSGVKTVIPAHGVYAGGTAVQGQNFAAAVHIGPNPTFGDATAKIEVHLLDFTGDLYGVTLSVDLIDHVRAVRRFADLQELQAQIQADIATVRRRVERADSGNSA